MGVSGFTPFLQKFCPTVLRKFPDRLKALEGKRIVIDGTLITQRFHFMSNELPNYHVLGWYRLARELNKHNISTICVFDGKDRNLAKANEAKRRLEVRQLTLVRGSIEDTRYQRLHDLKTGMDQLQSLDDAAKREILGLLKEPTPKTKVGSRTLLDEIESLKEASVQLPGLEIPTTSAEPRTTSEVVTPTTPEYLADLLRSLHVSYQANIAEIAIISTDIGKVHPNLPEETPTERKMTKQQHELTVQEGKIWGEICGGADKLTLDISEVTEKEVDTLLGKSQIMANSFQKRNKPPTAKTYWDSKEILKAMGVMCIDATGGIEAEALASSMVLEGIADYVVSEDTDVLVYEAPLIRNITSAEPLLIISGAEARKELKLDRAAYVDLALLLGTDFSQRIKNLGPVRAYDFIKKYGTIEKILDAIETQPKYELKLSREDYLAEIKIARLVFGSLPPLPPPELMQKVEKNDEHAGEVLRHYGLERFLTEEIDYEGALAGHYFGDDPRAA